MQSLWAYEKSRLVPPTVVMLRRRADFCEGAPWLTLPQFQGRSALVLRLSGVPRTLFVLVPMRPDRFPLLRIAR